MKEKYVFAFDIGSSRLRAMIAGSGLNNTFAVKCFKEIEYDGFYEGEFLNKEQLPKLFQEIVQEFSPYLKKIKKIYVGVPAEFSSVMQSDCSLNFPERRKIRKDDVEQLFYMASEKSKNTEVEVVSVSPITFDVDGKSMLDPVGYVGSSLIGKLSVVYANKMFIDLFNDIASSLGFQYVEYISEVLAQAQFILPKDKKEDLALLVDSGDITTSIALVKGKGIKMLTSLSRGGGFITNDLAEAFNLSIKDALKLKNEVVLSIKGKSNDCYDVVMENGKIERVLLNTANEVVAYRIEEMAEVVNQCLQEYSNEYISHLPIYLTGGGISKVKGGKDYLAKCLGRNVTLGVPPIPGQDKPTMASIYSLVDYALSSLAKK